MAPKHLQSHLLPTIVVTAILAGVLSAQTDVAHDPVPADGTVEVPPTGVTLRATVENPNGSTDPVTVDFWGHEKQTFSIIALPDTQYYSQSYPEVFNAQTQWIADNAAALNIVFVTHEGDIVQNSGASSEWANASTAIGLLGGVPYGLAVGNHDFDYTGDDSELFDQTFGTISCSDWHPDPSRRNNCQGFTAGGNSFVVLHLEFWPDSDDIAWAQGVLQDYQDAIAIITTHGFLDGSGNRNVHVMGSTEYIWEQLVVPNDNVHFVLCGHVHAEHARTDSVNGRLVHQLLADYQGEPNGGNGWLRIMTFAPNEDKVYVQTYSPWLDQYQTDENSEFVLDLPMSDTVIGYDLLGTNESVAPNTTTSLAWPYDLNLGTAYEWYVTVTDETTSQSQDGPVWDFTTTSSNLSVSLQSPVDVTVSQNPVTFTARADCLVGNPDNASLYLGSPASVEDAQITESTPSTPDGESASINVDGENPHAHALIKFRGVFGAGLDQVPFGATIDSATLNLYCTDTGNTMDLYRVTGDWSEATVTWDTAPGYDSSLSLPGDCSATGWRDIAVTPFVQAWSDGQPNCGILLTDTGTQGVDFHSSEGSNPPTLTVTYQGTSLQFTAGSAALNRMEEITLPGDTSSETVTFSPLTLADGNYTWNCLVTTTEGEACWAPSDAQFSVDTINDAPTARDDDYSVSVNDPEEDSLTAALTGEPTDGTVTLNANGSFTYTPDAGFAGTDTFLYVADDGELMSTEATVRITVEVPVLFSDDFESGGFAAGGWGVTAQASVETKPLPW